MMECYVGSVYGPDGFESDQEDDVEIMVSRPKRLRREETELSAEHANC